jgi:ribose/xylose/arabinose/galactoside ABC-type transport system permease subunit
MKTMLRKAAWICLNNSIVIVLVGLCILMRFLSDKFFTAANWINILNNLSVTGIVAFGVALVVIAGGIDLSFGSILGCCAVFSAWLQPHGFWLAVLGALVLGGLLGGLNGIIIAKIEANPLITTLGTQWFYFSLLFIITQGHLVQGNAENVFHLIGQGRLLDIPIPVYILVGTCLLTWFIATQTAFGKYIYAHGSNKLGLRYSGVNAANIYLYTFIFMGGLVGIGGIVLSARLTGVRPTEGSRYLLIVLTTVLLSGVSLSGGTGSIFHVLVAALVLGVIDNSMVLLSVEYKYQQMIRGCVFILSIVYNNRMSNKVAAFRIIKE